jgi:choline dehydrogenase-like flavoprotein
MRDGKSKGTRCVPEALLTLFQGDVVDNKLLVKGTANIRVADGSIFPNHVSGNMVSSVYAVAEKAADIIKESWK